MAVIACPGCGLPRADDRVGVVPCPVCADMPATHAAVPVAGSHPTVARTETPDPTAGLPADVSELARASDASGRSRVWFGWAVAFLLGLTAGVGGVFAWRAAFPVAEVAEGGAESGAVTRDDPPGSSHASLPTVAVAPMPREWHAPEPAPAPKLVAKVTPRPPAQAVVIDLDQPDAVYNLPPALRKGGHVILRGKLREFRVDGLDEGAIVDASRLEVGCIYVTGKIDGGSVLKLKAPESVVGFMAVVDGKSRVEIDAPGGRVRFTQTIDPDWPGALIGGGSTVAITARAVDLRGNVDGAGTTVSVRLTRNGSLKVAGVRGSATVEYRTEDAKSTATADVVGPNATFRKIDD